jgi:hypothetical protein
MVRSWFSWLGGKAPPPEESRGPVVHGNPYDHYRQTLPWEDVDITTFHEPPVLRPINIKRVMLERRYHLIPGDMMQATITYEQDGTVLSRESTPTFPVPREMTVDSVTKFEVIDELGIDVGIGFVFGEAKK